MNVYDFGEIDITPDKFGYKITYYTLFPVAVKEFFLHTQTISVDMPLFSRSTKPYRC